MVNFVFDYDGTLHDCIQIYAPAFRKAYGCMVAEGHAPERSWQDKELEKWLGLPSREMWDRFAPQLSREEKERYSQMIGEEMLRLTKAGQARLYPQIPQTLDWLRKSGCRLLFLSNCERVYLEAHRSQFQLERYFSAFYCAEDYNWIPKTQIFPVMQARFEGEFIVAGDRRHDMDVARAHGLKAIGCGYGYGAPGELNGADVVIQSPEELLEAARGFL